MIVWLLGLAVCTGLTAASVRRAGLLSGYGVFAITLLVNLFVFWLVGIQGVYPPRASIFWQVQSDYASVQYRVLFFYGGLLLLAAAGSRVSTRGLQESTSGAGARLLPDDAATRRIRRYLLSPPWTLGLLALFLIALVHGFMVDWGELWSYSTYLSVRDPSYVGVDVPVLTQFHRGIGLLGALLAPLMVIYVRLRRPVHLVLAGLVTLYALVLTLAFDSRFTVVILALTALTLQLTSRRRIEPAAVVAGFMAVVAYGVVLSIRRGVGLGVISSLGLAGVAQALAQGAVLIPNLVLFGLFNFFGGGFVMAEAFRMGTVTYPIAYKLLSFSPLPSALDGFDAVRSAQVRVNPSAPFSNFAEVLHFGPFYWLLMALLLGFVLHVTTRFWQRSRKDGTAFLVLIPMCYGLLKMQQYPLRHTVRWLLMSGLISAYLIHRMGPGAGEEAGDASAEI